MKILLTGVTGFIGSHIARILLQHGHEIHALILPADNRTRIADIESQLHFHPGNLLDSSFTIPNSSFSACLHLAWYVEPGKYVDSPLNRDFVTASLRLATKLRNAGCPRFVAAGTCFEYDYAVPADTISESHPTNPDTFYGKCKLELFHSLQQLDMSVAWTRFFYQYGPFEDPRRLVPVIINNLLAGQRAALTPGEQVRDFLHIEDVASAVVAVAESNLTGAVNIGSNQPITIRQLAGKMGEIIGRPDLLEFGARPYGPGEPPRIVADNSKLRSTGWTPRYNLDTGLRHSIAWWKSQIKNGV